MKFEISKNKVLLLLTYLSMSLFFLTFVANREEIGIVLPFIMLLIISYDSLLHGIQQFTGDHTSDAELSFFSALIELNKNVQNFHEIGQVLSSIDQTLKEKIRFSRTIFLVNQEFFDNIDSENNEATGTVLCKWPQDKRKFKFLDEDFEHQVLRSKSVYDNKDANPILQRAFSETNTSLAIPLIQEDKLLCLILIGRVDNTSKKSNFENQALDFMANQLTIVLDRILMYQKISMQTAMDHAEKMQVMQSLSTNIAHEMRTPLSGIRASITGVDTYLPDLIKAYDFAIEKKCDGLTPIRESHLQAIKGTPSRITLMIDQANAVIDMLLMNLRENSINQKQLNICDARECIEQAIDRYPFKRGERQRVSLELTDNFSFLGIESLFVYIIFNLMKNALYSLSSIHDGNITISLIKGVENNYIIFRDTGKGIENDILDKIFDGFFTTKNDGTGVGLAYCKRTAENFGGNIKCSSEVGSYAEFKINLPLLN